MTGPSLIPSFPVPPLVATDWQVRATPSSLAPAEPPPAVPSAPAGGPLATVCTELGWPVVQRDPDTYAIELDVGPGFHQAVLRQDATGVVRLRADLLSSDLVPTPVSVRAVTALLWRVTDTVRLIRPLIVETPTSLSVSVEVALPDPLDVATLRDAAAALSVVSRLCRAELDVLAADAHLAELYLTTTHPGNHINQKGD